MSALWLYWLVGWLVLAVVGSLALYVGYGFVMSAKRARDAGLSQDKVVKVDGSIAVFFVVLDAVLNVLVWSVLMLDFRREYTLTLITKRLSLYNQDGEERKFRKFAADLAAPFLDPKDPSGDHISGPNYHFTWLD